MAVDEDSWSLVRAFTYKATGVVLEAQRDYLLTARVEPLARSHGLSLRDFVRAATAPAAPPKLVTALVDAMTTHETSFFRDPTFWGVLEKTLLPAVMGRGARPLRIWSAACSTGQEAYSMAMLLNEKWPSVLGTSYMLATDIAEPTLVKARAGAYCVTEINRGLGAARLLINFEQKADEFRVKSHIRSRVTWMQQNLLGPAPYPSGFDLVLCRNVLIYFDEADRQGVLDRLIRSVAPGGYLGLGSTELMKKSGVGGGWYAVDARGAAATCVKCKGTPTPCRSHDQP